MKIDVRVDFSKASKLIAKLSGPEFRVATAKALTDAGFEARKVVQAEIDKSFDRPTPYIRRSISVTPAKPEKLEAIVEPRYQGGKGIDPKNILLASVFGGQRKNKASENALRRVGILQPGYSIVPGEACPLDQYGNVRGSFTGQLISYFQTFGEQGYRANMTQRRKNNLAKAGVTESGFKVINGVQYFVSFGRLRGIGDSTRVNHLPYGIWSRSGIHGIKVQPILMFVKTPGYKKRLNFFDKPVKAAIDKFNPRLRYHMRTILESAR